MARKKKTASGGDGKVVELPPVEKRAKTGNLPGVEGPGVSPVAIPEIEALGDEYVTARDRRMKVQEKEVEAKEKLVDALHKHAKEIGKNDEGEIRYVYAGGDKDRRVIVLRPSDEKLKVKDVEAFEEVNV